MVKVNMSISIVVEGILSYPNVFKPVKYVDDPTSVPKFTCSLLIKKSDPQINLIENTIAAVQQSFFPNGMPAKAGNHVLIDCMNDMLEEVSLHEYMVVRAKASEDRRPTIFDVNRKDVIDPSRVKPGDIGKMDISIFGFKTSKGGISAGLNGVMILENEGVLGRLGNIRHRDDMFRSAAEGRGAPVVPIMTAKALGVPYNTFIMQGWSDETLLANGYLAPVVPTMTMLANGVSYEKFIAQGWSDEMLLANGYLAPNKGI